MNFDFSKYTTYLSSSSLLQSTNSDLLHPIDLCPIETIPMLNEERNKKQYVHPNPLYLRMRPPRHAAGRPLLQSQTPGPSTTMQQQAPSEGDALQFYVSAMHRDIAAAAARPCATAGGAVAPELTDLTVSIIIVTCRSVA